MSDRVKQIIIYLILMLAVISFLTSCSASWHIRQAQKKDSSLFDTIQIIKSDTVYISDSQKDTIVEYKIDVRDSIIFKDKTKVKYIIKRDSFEIEVDCPDQVIVTDSVFVINTMTVKEGFVKKVKSLWYLILIGLILGLGLSILLKK